MVHRGPTHRADLHVCKPGHLIAPPPQPASAAHQISMCSTHTLRADMQLVTEPDDLLMPRPSQQTQHMNSSMDAYRADMQQMEGKWSQWWRQSTDMCDNLQQQMALLTSQQEATAQRLDHLHHQVITLTPLSYPSLAPASPLSYHRLASVSPLPHSCLASVSPQSHPGLAPVLP